MCFFYCSGKDDRAVKNLSGVACGGCGLGGWRGGLMLGGFRPTEEQETGLGVGVVDMVVFRGLREVKYRAVFGGGLRRNGGGQRQNETEFSWRNVPHYWLRCASIRGVRERGKWRKREKEP